MSDLQQTVVRSRCIVLCGLAAGMAISGPLWRSAHSFPQFPLFNLPLRLPPPWDLALLLPTLLALLVALFRPRDRRPLWLFLALLGLLALLDQMRWQPWAYQYLLLLVPLALLSDKGRSHRAEGALDLQRWILAAVYFWGGVHKFGPGFQHMFEHFMMRQVLAAMPGIQPAVMFVATLIPVFEAAMGIGLLFPLTRRYAAGCAIGMHLLVLALLGPFGHNVNAVVWPWNLAMIALLVLLFLKPGSRSCDYRGMFEGRLGLPAALILLLVWVLPLFYFVGRWDHYLSFNLYSGRSPRIVLFISEAAEDRLDPRHRALLVDSNRDPGWKELRFYYWAMNELQVPPVSDDRILLGAARRVLKPGFSESEAFLYRDYPHLLKHRGFAQYTPQEVMAMRRFPPQD